MKDLFKAPLHLTSIKEYKYEGLIQSPTAIN